MIKDIVIAVTGGIAAYKTCDLVRSLTKKNYPVRVIMTQNATHFVGKTTFEALTNRAVFINEYESIMVHIEVKNQAALLAIVPATANIIGKMANGIGDDLVSTTYLACTVPVLIAPAMNPGMYANKAVQRNLKLLMEDGVQVIEPEAGVVVCGDEGKGKLADILIIENKIIELYEKH
jgi:phosphopantothenoylcysteine decarboxylase